MALAIRFGRLIREGVVADQSELARLSLVTQPRMTQIMNLLHLAPDIQEDIPHSPRVTDFKDLLTEKMLRPVMVEVGRGRQRKKWKAFVNQKFEEMNEDYQSLRP